MKAVCKCGSYAINHHCHGRDGSDGDLCDVCYWRKRAEQQAQQQEPAVWTATRLWNRKDTWTCPADIEKDLLDGCAPPAQQPKAKAIAECLAVLRPLVKGKFPHEQALEELVGYIAAPQPAQQETVAWTDLLKTADEIVRGKTVWKRFIDGTPLANDIAVWMADFVQQHTSPPASKPWVGLTPEDKVEILRANGEAAVLILAEAKLREKNAQSSKPLTDHQTMSITFNHHWLNSMTLRDAYRLGIRDAEAAHGIAKGTK